MSDDDPFKKMMNTPEWLRQTTTPDWLRPTTTLDWLHQITAPALDALRSQIDTRQAFTFDNIALRGLDVIGHGHAGVRLTSSSSNGSSAAGLGSNRSALRRRTGACCGHSVESSQKIRTGLHRNTTGL
jgi:hypothetical protein